MSRIEKIKDPAKIDKVIHTYVLCHFLASDCVTSQQLYKYRLVVQVRTKRMSMIIMSCLVGKGSGPNAIIIQIF